MISSTRTYIRLFDSKTVDELCGKLHSTLESDYLKRKEYISKKDQRAIEARLDFIRAVWILLLDSSSD